jgi:hypothetical protein
MIPLHIHLEEGFANDAVVVRIGGIWVAERTGVTTRTQLGLATIVEESVEPARVTVTLEVPTRRTAVEVTVDPRETPYIGCSLDAAGQPSCRLSREILGYA